METKRRIRPLAALALAVTLLGGSAAAYAHYDANKKPLVRFETKAIEPAHLVAKVTATGTLSALVTVQVGSQVSGRIQSLHADFNSAVKKGEVLAVLDPELFQAAVAQAQANAMAAAGGLAKAHAQADNAKLQLQRATDLAKEQLVSTQDLETAKTASKAAQADVIAAQGGLAQAQAALATAKVNLANATIAAPIDGVVISRSVDVGQTVAAALQAPTLFTIAENLHKMQVDTSVAEADVGKLQPGMKATFTVDAFPGQTFVGVVRQIRNAAQTVQNVVTYDAVIDVENADLKLRPGMTANVSFVFAEVEAPVVVPNAALRFHPSSELLAADGQKPEASKHGAKGGARAKEAVAKTVWILRDGHLARVAVKLGVSDGTSSEVVGSDLHEGDVVVVDASGATATSGSPPGGKPGGGGMGRML